MSTSMFSVFELMNKIIATARAAKYVEDLADQFNIDHAELAQMVLDLFKFSQEMF